MVFRSPKYYAELRKFRREQERKLQARKLTSSQASSSKPASPEHLKNIFEVCKRTPGTRHWMPTREVKFLTLMDPDVVPENLIIRISSHMINQGPVKHWPWTSTVSTKPEDRTCAAPDQGNECKDCRACWSRDVANICYGKH